MARSVTLHVCVDIAFWLRLYLNGVAFMHMLTGLDPDWTKVEKMIHRGVRVRIMKKTEQ